MKKILSLLLTLMLIYTFTACSDEDTSSSEITSNTISLNEDATPDANANISHIFDASPNNSLQTEQLCYIKSCNYIREKNSKYCGVHMCLVDNCTKKRTGAYYCSKHDCADNSCDLQALDGEKYCRRCKLKHTVSHNESGNSAKCIIENCNNNALIENKYCVGCYLDKCHFENCNKLSSDDFYYCPLHKCTVDTCSSPKTDDDYCAYHSSSQEQTNNQSSCVYDNCVFSKEGTSNFCKFHKCKACNKSNTGKPYCSLHSCYYFNCNNQSIYSNCCSSHKCARAGCQSVKTMYSFYCAEHS